MGRTTLIFLALAAALVAAFGYGYRAHRDRLFPANLIEPPPTPAGKRLTNGSLIWQPLRQPADDSLDARRRSASEVESLPYLQGYKRAGGEGGVTLNLSGEASPGVSLYLSGHAPEARLIDMNGAVLHEWRRTFRDAFPSATIPPDRQEESTFWRRVHLCPNGDVIAIFQGLGIIRIDKDSKLLWAVSGGFHHALDVDTEGRIYALEGEWKKLPRISREGPLMEDFVSVLDKDGRRLAHISLLRSFERSDYASALARMETPGDVFHTNAIRVLDGSLEKRAAIFKKGNLLLSCLGLNSIAVVDPGEAKVVWALSGMWHGLHEPVLLPSGRMLVFDNRGQAGDSRVLEFDPFTQVIAWRYAGSPALPLSSWKAGTSSRLPNGNTLITESTAGRALEVTPEGKLVWEFMNPFRAGERHELIATLYDMRRYAVELPYKAWGEPAAR
jgi:hypothetical protein